MGSLMLILFLNTKKKYLERSRLVLQNYTYFQGEKLLAEFLLDAFNCKHYFIRRSQTY